MLLASTAPSSSVRSANDVTEELAESPVDELSLHTVSQESDERTLKCLLDHLDTSPEASETKIPGASSYSRVRMRCVKLPADEQMNKLKEERRD